MDDFGASFYYLRLLGWRRGRGGFNHVRGTTYGVLLVKGTNWDGLATDRMDSGRTLFSGRTRGVHLTAYPDDLVNMLLSKSFQNNESFALKFY